MNKECFMNILAEIWNEWATPECIVKAGKRVGISKDGLSVKWMDQRKFEQADAILAPPMPTKNTDSTQLSNPQKGFVETALLTGSLSICREPIQFNSIQFILSHSYTTE